MGIPVMVTLGASAGAFFATMKSAEASLIGLSETGKITEDSLAKLNTRMSVGIVAAAGLMIGESVKLATDFQSTMEWLVTSAGLPQPAMKELGDSFLQMAGQVGVSANDLAKSSYYVLSQLQTNAKDTATVMHATAELAKIDNSDLQTTTIAVATAMRDYGVAASGAVSVSDQFRAAVALSNTTVGEFSGNLGRVFQAAETAHIGLSNVLAAVATLTSEGMNAANASTLLASTIDHLSAVTPAGAAALKGMGIDVLDFEKTIDSPNGLVNGLTMLQDGLKRVAGADGFEHLTQVAKSSKGDIQAVIDAIGKMPEKTQTAIKTISDVAGGVRGLGVVLGLTGDNLNNFVTAADKVGLAAKGAGANVDGWNGVQTTLKQKLSEANAGIQSMAIQLGQALLPAITQIIGGLNTFLGFLERNKWAMDAFLGVIGILVGSAMINLIGRMGAMVTAAKDLAVVFFSEVIPSLVEFATVSIPAAVAGFIEMAAAAWSAAAGVIAATWPILLIIAAIALLAFGIYEVIKHWTWIKDHTTGVWQPVEHAVGNVVHAFWNFVHAMVNTGHAIMNVVHAFDNFIHAMVNVGHAIMNVYRFLEGLRHALSLSGMLSAVNQVLSSIGGAFSAAWVRIRTDAEHWWSDIVGFLRGIWNSIVNFARSIWNDIVAAVVAGWNAILAYIQGLGDSIINAIKHPWDVAINVVRGFIPSFMTVGYDIVMGIIHGVENAAGALFGALRSLASSALNAAKSALGIGSPSRLFADEVGQWMVKGIATGITENAHHVTAALSGAVDPSKVKLGGAYGGGVGAGGQGGSSVTINLTVHGSIYGQGGARGAANEIWKELLTMQRQGSLGFVGAR